MPLSRFRSLVPALLLRALQAPCTYVGGQAVMEGVMLRNGPVYALAVRQPDGSIVVERRPWFSLTNHFLLRQPFVRGFPTLLETLVNGIKALNRSAEFCANQDEEELKPWHLTLMLFVSLLFAILLFVVAPHLLTMGMAWLGLSADVEGFSFHVWDGLFKLAIFMGYIVAISFVPDIRRVFRYHGAEHKVIRAFESGGEISVDTARDFSRFHPRCGTTFLLFVLSIAIILHTVLVPLFLIIWPPSSFLAKHGGAILFKLLLMIPISALAYELIRYTGRLNDGLWGSVLRAPGMFLQMLTTWEPDTDQIEVAVAALDGVLGPDTPHLLKAPAYRTE